MIEKIRTHLQRKLLTKIAVLAVGGAVILPLAIFFFTIEPSRYGFVGTGKVEKTENVLLVSQQTEVLGAKVFVNGVNIGRLSTSNDSKYRESRPHIFFQVKPGNYLIRVEKAGYKTFERVYEIRERIPEPGTNMGDYIIFINTGW